MNLLLSRSCLSDGCIQKFWCKITWRGILRRQDMLKTKSSNTPPFLLRFYYFWRPQLAAFCPVLLILWLFKQSQRQLHIRQIAAKQGKLTQIRRNLKYDTSAFRLPRQCLRDGSKALILLGFLDGNVEFTPYLHLWKIGSV